MRAEPVVLPDNKTFAYADSKPHIGYAGIALQTSFYELLHAPDFTSGMKSVVRRGGDVDTNGAITGSLLGALFGAQDIPMEWIVTVRNAPPVLQSRGRVRTPENVSFLEFTEDLIIDLSNL